MATRKPLTQPRVGKTKPTYLRFPEYVRYYLDRKCDTKGMKFIDVVVNSIQDGEYYQEDLARSVDRLFKARPEIAEEYRKPFIGGRPHHSYVTEEPLDVDTLAISEFIRQAIDAKIEAEAEDYVSDNKEERKRHWDWLHGNNE